MSCAEICFLAHFKWIQEKSDYGQVTGKYSVCILLLCVNIGIVIMKCRCKKGSECVLSFLDLK